MLGLAALGAPAAASAQATGGMSSSGPAVIERMACRLACGPGGAPVAGSTIRLRGRSMAVVRRIVFLGGPGARDDVSAPAAFATKDYVDVRVPDGAPSGRLRARNADGATSRPSAVRLTIGADEGAPASTTGPASPPATPGRPDVDTTERLDAHVDAGTVFYAGVRQATLRYVVTAPEPVEVAVELLRADGTEVRRWAPGIVAPGAEQRIDWDGTVDGAVAAEGRYRFRVTQAGATVAAAGDPAAEVVDSFRLLDHKFPVRGRYDFGGENAVFGTARTGHTHQGQDVFAACGTPLVAARGGTVVFQAFQRNAGNYVVIRGDGNGTDYAYMHLEQPAPVAKGERVRTGQPIGTVGETGNARGCHLHFELWSAPGWYEGGHPFDPLPELRAWAGESGPRGALRRR